MKSKVFLFAVAALCSHNSFAQNAVSPINSNQNQTSSPQTDAQRERREQAFAKLLEGQRFLWKMSRRSSPTEVMGEARAAKESFQKAVELDPTLAEAYTALAEVTLTVPPHSLEDALLLSNIAVKLNPNNYGAHRILARLYTIKSKLNRGDLDREFTAKAVSEWKEIARLDSRSAEAFAFLSEYYAKTNRNEDKIAALRNWIGAAAPNETRFYQTILGAQAELTAESASVKLGAALLDAGQTGEAIEIISRTVADNPENSPAIELLREAVESSQDKNSAAIAVQALTQAVYANPENAALVSLLAQINARAGKVDDAAKILLDSSAKLAKKDKVSAANLRVALGDIYLEADRLSDAIAIYETALTVRGISAEARIRDEERDFAIRVFEKMIQTAKKSARPNDAKIIIERARLLLGKEDFFADRQLITLYRETGKTAEALQTARALRVGNTDDYGLLRLEASILTDGGRIDEAVALLKPLIGKKPALSSQADKTAANDANQNLTMYSPMYDDFTNYLFISNLYSQAKRGREAVEAANQAVDAGQNDERKQIARLSLATAQQQSGDNAAAETTLRALLKQSPGNPIALNNLGYFLVERNANLTEALNFIEQAVKIDPTNSSYLDSLGWAYFKLDNLAQAEKFLKEAARFDAASATIHEHLGDVYEKQGKPALAKSVWQKSLNLAFDREQIARLKSKINRVK